MAGPLEKYRRKRNFQVTREPAPGKIKTRKRGAPTFMVHKHDATRLHYDLRLETHGVLASWAVPKGPSYDPSIRRLAVQTEDHPLEYGKFEGRIPEGEYGAGDSIIWDRGTYETVPPGQMEAMLKKGHIQFVLDGEKLHGRWHLVRTRPVGGKAQWLLFKAHDAFADPARDVVAERPESVKSGVVETHGPEALERRRHKPIELLLKVWPPMLATLGEVEDVSTATHVLELKYDGFRALSGVVGTYVSMQSRNGLELNGRFPEVAEALSKLGVREAVLDGEVIATGADGLSGFQAMQAAAGIHRYAIFDLLWLNGEDLREQPLETRRAKLEALLAGVKPPLLLAERVRGPVEKALQRAANAGEEGLLAKLKHSAYVGERTRDWVKLKVSATQELVILGFTPMSNGKPQVGALLVGVREGKGYRFAGKVGTGFDTRLRERLFRELGRDETDQPPVIDRPRVKDARWVKPRLVAQIAFTEWTRDGKLRHPRFQGLRDDKAPAQVVREQPSRGSKRAPAEASPRRRRR